MSKNSICTELDLAVAKCENYNINNNFRVWVECDDKQVVFDCIADDWEHAYNQALEVYPDGRPTAANALPNYSPSTNWSQGGPIIERENINLLIRPASAWMALIYNERLDGACIAHGPTPLIAAMRCYVRSKRTD